MGVDVCQNPANEHAKWVNFLVFVTLQSGCFKKEQRAFHGLRGPTTSFLHSPFWPSFLAVLVPCHSSDSPAPPHLWDFAVPPPVMLSKVSVCLIPWQPTHLCAKVTYQCGLLWPQYPTQNHTHTPLLCFLLQSASHVLIWFLCSFTVHPIE